LINSLHFVIVTDVITGVSNGPAFILTTLSSRWWRPSAVFAFINGSELVLEIVSDILLARASNQAGIMSILVNLSRVSTVTRATSLSVDDNLSVNRNGGSSLEVVQDVESISDGRCTSLSPA
jgi:hypothetical protein